MLQAWELPGGTLAWRDPLMNVLLYIPLGLTGAMALQRKTVWFRHSAPVVLGFLLSFGIEVAQVYDAFRFPSAVDLLTNTVGALLGSVLAAFTTRFLAANMLWLQVRVQRMPSASLLIGLWFVQHFYPLFPDLSFYRMLPKFGAFFRSSWSPVAMLTAASTVLSLGLLLQVISRTYSRFWIPLMALAYPAQLFVLGRQATWSEAVGALSGALAFAFFGRHKRIHLAAGMLFLGMLLVRGMIPFDFGETPHVFSWIPFAATLESERTGALPILIGKCFYYGSAVWLLRVAGLRLAAAAAVVAAPLGLIEVAQMYLPGRTPEITDPLLALFMAVAIAWADRKITPVRAISSSGPRAYPRRVS